MKSNKALISIAFMLGWFHLVAFSLLLAVELTYVAFKVKDSFHTFQRKILDFLIKNYIN
jgi:hypothetical protein